MTARVRRRWGHWIGNAGAALPVAILIVALPVRLVRSSVAPTDSILSLRAQAADAHDRGDLPAELRAWRRVGDRSSPLDFDRVEARGAEVRLLAEMGRCGEVPAVGDAFLRRYRLHPLAAYAAASVAATCAHVSGADAMRDAVQQAVRGLDPRYAAGVARVTRGAFMAGSEQQALRLLRLALAGMERDPARALRLLTDLSVEARKVTDNWLPAAAAPLLLPAVPHRGPELARGLLDAFVAWDPPAAATHAARASQGDLAEPEQIRQAWEASLGREVRLAP